MLPAKVRKPRKSNYPHGITLILRSYLNLQHLRNEQLSQNHIAWVYDEKKIAVLHQNFLTLYTKNQGETLRYNNILPEPLLIRIIDDTSLTFW